MGTASSRGMGFEMHRCRHHLQLRGKIVAGLLGVMLLFGGIDYFVQRYVVYPQFVALEYEEATVDIERCRLAIQQELDHLSLLARDWSAWDDSHQFVQDRNQHFIQSTLQPGSYAAADINSVYYFDLQGKCVWGKSYNLKTKQEVSLEELNTLSTKFPDFVRHHSATSSQCGFLMTALGPMMLASLPITNADATAPPQGTLVMGRLMGPALISRISTQIRTPLRVAMVGIDDLNEYGREALAATGSTANPVLYTVDEELNVAFTHFQDLAEAPAVQLQLYLARAISLSGRNSVRFATMSLALGCITVLGLLLWLIQEIVISPLGELTKHATAISASGDLTLRAPERTQDEIGLLAAEFNMMVDRLAESHRDMVTLSREAGMAQVASGVLHNIGNVLASVNCVTDSLRTGVQNSKMHNLSRIAEMIASNAHDWPAFIAHDPRGQQLLPYVQQLATRWQEESERFQHDVQTLLVNVQHITTVVEAQQKHAKRTKVLEIVTPDMLANEACELSERSLQKHHVVLRKTLDESAPKVRVDRAQIAQVLVNLITNAKDSLLTSGLPNPEIHVRVSAPAPDRVAIEVADNGGGIAPENLAKIFGNGFSTKSQGRGFGLHFSALAIQELGGALTVHSPGVGQGATFRIELPSIECLLPAAGQRPLARDESAVESPDNQLVLV